jgi:hypothetical protein
MAAVPNTSAAQIADNVINFQYKKCVPRMRGLGFFFVSASFRRPCAAPPTALQFSALRQHDLPFFPVATVSPLPCTSRFEYICCTQVVLQEGQGRRCARASAG